VIDTLAQFAGRLHPVVLHLPIGLLVGLVVFEVVLAALRRPVAPQLRAALVWLAALTASAAVGSGLLLAQEADQTAPVLRLHQWLGITIAAACVLAALVQPRGGGGLVYRFMILVALGATLAGAHLGATMTHGTDYLLEPFRTVQVSSLSMPAAGALPDVVTARCTGCHNDTRPKSGLSLASLDAALQGGESGVVLVLGDAAASELARRIALPGDDDDHMPPPGKPQLTAEEIALITTWINDPGLVTPPEAPVVDTLELPPAAPPDSIAALEDALVHVEPIGSTSTLLYLDAAASAAQVDDALARKLLAPVSAQAADIALARTRITDDLLPLLAEMPNLRRIDLTDTAVTDAGLAELRHHEQLKELVLVNTAVTDASVDVLAGLPALTRVYAWGSKLSADGIGTLQASRPELVIDDGQVGETEALELEPEIVLTKAETDPTALNPINETCPVSGSPIDPAFAIVYKGRVVGFCCQNCPSTFWKDPAAFESKLP
jgi:uncharacterized membrane protein/YHS domain-containing protein